MFELVSRFCSKAVIIEQNVRSQDIRLAWFSDYAIEPTWFFSAARNLGTVLAPSRQKLELLDNLAWNSWDKLVGLGKIYIFETTFSPFECFKFSSVVRLGTRVLNYWSRMVHLLGRIFQFVVYTVMWSQSPQRGFSSLEAKRVKCLARGSALFGIEKIKVFCLFFLAWPSNGSRISALPTLLVHFIHSWKGRIRLKSLNWEPE